MLLGHMLINYFKIFFYEKTKKWLTFLTIFSIFFYKNRWLICMTKEYNQRVYIKLLTEPKIYIYIYIYIYILSG